MNTQLHSPERTAERPAVNGREFAIAEWHDTAAVMSQLDALLAQPPRTIRRENMDKVLKWFEDNCSKSRELAEQAAGVIPGGVQHNLAFNYPHPLAITEANGAYMTDADGNRYIDCVAGQGTANLGRFRNAVPLDRNLCAVPPFLGPETSFSRHVQRRPVPTVRPFERGLGDHIPGSVTLDVLNHALEEGNKALRPGVDDACFPQNR